MNKSLRLVLQVSPEQAARLHALQAAFADVCNALAPRVQQTRCWHRVTLHHLTYRDLRQQFPQLGSQMVCNAIYSVCKTARLVFQDPASPFNVQRQPDKQLPLIRFSENSPVYFDRHTLSVRGDQVSMYTLDGRIRFRIGDGLQANAVFKDRKLREVILTRRSDGCFELLVHFADEQAQAPETVRAAPRRSETIPEYVQVETAA